MMTADKFPCSNNHRPSAQEPIALGMWLHRTLLRNPTSRGAGSLTDAIGWFLALRDSQGATRRELKAFARGFCGTSAPIDALVLAMVNDGRAKQLARATYAAGNDAAWDRATDMERMVQS